MNRQRLKNQAIFLGVNALSLLMRALPLAIARGLGESLGRLFFRLVRYERNKALRTLATAFPEKTAGEIAGLARDALASLGRGGAEFLRFPRTTQEELKSWVSGIDGLEPVQEAMRSGRGVVAVAAHTGNWEVLAACIAMQFPKTAVVAQKLYDPRFDEALNQYRRQKGVTIFPRNTPVKPILRWLRDGGMLGLLADQDTAVDSVFVPFFGRLAKTPSGPAWLARASGAALFTGFNYREEDGRYRIVFGPEIPMAPRVKPAPGGPVGDDPGIVEAVKEYTRRVEELIRAHPGQWVWIHERWRTKPPVSTPNPAQ